MSDWIEDGLPVFPTCLLAASAACLGRVLLEGYKGRCRSVARSMAALVPCGGLLNVVVVVSFCSLSSRDFGVEGAKGPTTGKEGKSRILAQSIRTGAKIVRALSAFHLNDPISAAKCTCNRVLALIDF